MLPLPVPGAPVVLLALVGAGPLASQDGVRCPDWGPERLRRAETRLVERVNARRLLLGRRRLLRDPGLDRVARRHATAMAERQHMGHRGPGGSLVDDRLLAAGIRDWSETGENLGRASAARYKASDEEGRFPSVSCHDPASLGTEIEAGWAVSPGHREALLSPGYGRVGSGAAYDAAGEHVYVVHVYADSVACGFRGGPCCIVDLSPTRRACQVPLSCLGDVCRPTP